MVENLFLPEIPGSPMFVGDKKIMTVEWQEFFRTLFGRVGGLSGPNSDDTLISMIAGLYSIPKDYNKRIDELEKQINASPSPKSYDKDIDEILTRFESLPGEKDFTKDIADLKHAIEAIPSHRFKVPVPICMDYFDAVPSRGTESNWHGGLLSLAAGQALDSVPTDLPVTKGIGKVLIVINAGSDLVGEITITGESIDRNTGASTPADTDTITVDALTTDNSTTDSNGNTVNVFVGAYITSKWFTGSVVLSTTNLTLTDVDVYHVSFEQVNDSPELMLNTFDANIYTTNVAAEFDAYLHTLHVIGDKCNVDNESELHVGADGETAIANKYWRLRKGLIDEYLDGTGDGFWVDVHYSNSPVYVEDVTISVWLTKTLIVG